VTNAKQSLRFLRRSESKRSSSAPRRTIEIGLLVLSFLIITSFYVLASLGAHGHIPARLYAFLAIIFGLSAAAHISIARYAPRSSQVLLPLVSLLNGVGYVEIARWNPVKAEYQSFWTFVSVVGLFTVLKFVRRIRDLDRYRYTMLIAAAALMLVPLLPVIGLNVNGARLWIHLGGLTFQPVELAKILLVIFFASYFASNKEMLATPTQRIGSRRVINFSTLVPILATGAFALLVLGVENDIGFAMLLVSFFVTLLWIATGRLLYIGVGVAAMGVGGVIANNFFHQVHQRFSIWLDPWSSHALAHGSQQLIQGWFSLSAGGIAGTGLGLGQSGRWVFAITSDMIFSAIGEELGWLGIVLVITALLLIVGEGLKIAQKSHSDFSRLTGVGLALVLGFQSFYICAGVLRLLPLTGITLPFVAYGGSSLIANYAIIALLLRISDENNTVRAGGHISRINFD
jgi:cell division protein FtsW (lipid II flippase)